MKKSLRKLFCLGLSLVLGITAYPSMALADNPISQTQYTADPSPFIVRNGTDDPSDDVMYVLTSHDEDVIEGNFYTMKNHKVFSTTDMVNWTDHGVVFGQDWFEWGTTTQYRSWASQTIERNGKFYLYIPCLRKGGGDGVSGWRETGGVPGYGIGVCVSDNPYGPFVDALKNDQNPHGRPLIYGDWNDIDPTVYIDDDGQAYLFYGQQLKYYHLKESMIETIEPNGPNNKGTSFSVPNYIEGPWLGKHEGTYYFLWAANGGGTSAHHGGETLQYAYCTENSKKALGNYTFGGLLQDTTRGNSFTNHPGLSEEYKGHYYLFYHTDVLPNGGSYHRSVCCDELKFNANKTIDKVPMTESTEPVDTLNPYKRTEAETIAWERGIKTGWYDSPEDGSNYVYVYNTHNNDYILVRNVDFGDDGAIKFTAAIRKCKSNANGKIEVYLDGKKDIKYYGDSKVSYEGTGYKCDQKNLIATIDCDVEGNEWEEKTVDLDEKVTGVHDLLFVFKGSLNPPNNETTVDEKDSGMFQYDYWKMEGVPTPTPAPTPTPNDSNDDNKEGKVDNNNQDNSGDVKNQSSNDKDNLGNGNNNPSNNEPVDISVGGDVSKVKGLKVTKKGKKAVVKWKAATNAIKYQVKCSTNKKFKKSVKTLTVNKTKATFKKLKKGKKYYFKVCGLSSEIRGKFSKVKKVKF